MSICQRHLFCYRNSGIRASCKIPGCSFLHDVMLLTVFADRLLGSELAGSTRHGDNLALAVQFLDYPLLVLQSKSAPSTSTVDFKTGKAAAVDADDREVDFLLGHVPTTVLLLGVSNQSQPTLLATGQIDLQSPSSQADADTHTVHKQNVILRDAEQQPVACAELYASLQPGNSVHTQKVPSATHVAGAATGPWGWSSFPSTQHSFVHPEQQLVQLQPIAPQLHSAPHTMQHWPADPQLKSHTHVSSWPPSPVVLEHRSMLASNVAATACAPDGHPVISRSMPPGKENNQHTHKSADKRIGNSSNRAGSPSKTKRQAVSKDAVQAAALKASQLLAGSRGSKGAVAAKTPATRPKQQHGYQGYQGHLHKDPDVWSPPPPRPYRKYLDGSEAPTHPGTSTNKKVTTGPRHTAQMQQVQSVGLQRLKHQQMQHWHNSMQQQQRVHLPDKQHLDRSDSGEATSDDCIEVDDISCSLSAVLDKEWISNWQCGDALIQDSCPDTAAEAAGAGGLAPAAAAPGDAELHPHSKGKAADGAAQILAQPSLPADWQLPSHQQQQQQQQQYRPALQLQPNTEQLNPEQHQQVPVALQVAAGHSCHNCAATVSAAAQLLQAAQQAAANAQSSSPAFLGVHGTALGRVPQQQQFQGGISAATAVVWEMMTLMTLRAVMSQAVNSMANQLSSTVGQVLQQALGGIGHLAVNAAASADAAAGGSAAGSAAVPWAKHRPPQPSAPAAAAALRNSRGSAQSAGTVSKQRGRPTAAAAVAPAAAQAEEQLTPQQLQQQQEELHRQFEQLEALMVIRDDTSENGSSSSSTDSTRHSRHSRSDSRDGDLERQAPGRAMRKTGFLSRSMSTDGPDPATAAGMVVRLRRTMSGRKDGPALTLSRSASAAEIRAKAPDSIADSRAAVSATEADAKLRSAGAADAGWLTLDAAAPVFNAVGAVMAAAAVPAKRSSSGRITLPPIAGHVRDAYVEGSVPAAARGATAGYASQSSMRQKLSVASIDTTYSDNYEEDFELPDSPQPTSPKHQHLMPADINNAATSTAAQAAAAALDVLHRSLPAVTVMSPTQTSPRSRQQQQQQQGYQGPVRRVSSGGGIGSTSWQRTSFKLDRRGSELPEIPEIPEDLSSLDNLQDPGIESRTSVFRPQLQQSQQQVGSGAFANWLSGGVAAEAGLSSSRRTSKVLDSLDTLTESIMEEILPPAASSLSGYGSRELHTLSVPEMQGLPAAGARTMTAAMPANATRRAVTAPGPTATARSAQSGSSSTDTTQQQPLQQVPAARQLNTVDSLMSVDSTLDDLLASSDFAMPATAGSPHAGTTNEVAGVSATVDRFDKLHPAWSVALGPSSGTTAATSSQPAQQLQPMGSRRLARISSGAQKGLSNYDDVSFLSDDEEDPVAAVTVSKHQEGRASGQPGLNSGASCMSSLDGSDLDIEYSAMSAVGAKEATYKPSANKAVPASASTARAPVAASNRQSAGSAASTGSQKSSHKGTAARNAADVFYSHVSGTPSQLTGAAVASGRAW